jgi:hypothetical protein
MSFGPIIPAISATPSSSLRMTSGTWRGGTTIPMYSSPEAPSFSIISRGSSVSSM